MSQPINAAKKVLLLIMDGWGIAPDDKFNAIANAKTPNFDKLVREYPNTQLRADGPAVGLPDGQFGTSEVNHMTIGAGRIIWQDLPKINKAIEEGSFYTNPQLLAAMQHAVDHNSKLHLTGMFSDGGIHTTYQQPLAILEMLNRQGFKQPVCFHIFTDGRDTPPRSAERYMAILDEAVVNYPELDIRICTYQGRVFLDRDRDWARTETAFQLLANASGAHFSDWQSVVNFEYNQNLNDEYFSQYYFREDGKFEPNDSIIFYHYRTDRIYQLIKRTLDEKIPGLKVTTFIKVSDEFAGVEVAFPRDEIKQTLADAISAAGKTQLHVTETEKFPHVTFFLNGEKETELDGETWKMFESNRFVKPIYQVEPSMRNGDITQEIVKAIETDSADFIVANLCTPDMVGHTGDYHAAVVSAQSVDYCLGKIYAAVQPKLADWAVIVTADHGNSEIMWDYENDQPHTQHTSSPVPLILISDIPCRLDRRESLEDVAPTILSLMGIDKPATMTGTTLVIPK